MPFKGTPLHLMSSQVKKQAYRKSSKAHLAERNPQWKGKTVGYCALHQWLHTRLSKPTLCQRCHIRPAYDLANKSKLYTRELEDWWWLCRHCHMEIDGRLAILHNQNKTGWFRECNFCSKIYWVTPWDWNNGQGRFCSKRCSNKGRYLSN